MKYELEGLEEFIHAYIDLYKSSPADTIVPGFLSKEAFLIQKITSIKKDLKSFLFEAESENRIELLIQFHQTAIIRLADKVSTCLDQNESGTNAGHTKVYLCKLIYDGLEELLTFIETYFSKYFDQDQKIPDAYVQLEKKSFLEKLDFIKTKSLELGLDARLIEIILYPVWDFENATSEKDITYRRLIYLKQLLKDFKTLLSSAAEDRVYDEAFKLLCYLNFNSRFFVIYATDRISSEAMDQESLTAQVEKLCHWLKVLNQNQVKPGFALHGNKTSFQEQLSIWLTEEINYIEKKKQLTLLLPPSEPLMHEKFKVSTVLSVPQLACMIRLLKETGIVTNRNQIELIRFFSKHFSSAQNENVSSESLRVKYYQVERSTMGSMQAFLERMIAHTKKTKW